MRFFWPPSFRTILLVLASTVALVGLGILLLFFYLDRLLNAPFSTSQTLSDGTVLTHEGTCSAWNGDWNMNSRLWIQRPGSRGELIWAGEDSGQSGDCPQIVPDTTAQVLVTQDQPFL